MASAERVAAAAVVAAERRDAGEAARAERDEALRGLANHRADRIKAYLTEKLAPERVLLTASRPDAAGIEDKGRTTRVQFNLR